MSKERISYIKRKILEYFPSKELFIARDARIKFKIAKTNIDTFYDIPPIPFWNMYTIHEYALAVTKLGPVIYDNSTVLDQEIEVVAETIFKQISLSEEAVNRFSIKVQLEHKAIQVCAEKHGVDVSAVYIALTHVLSVILSSGSRTWNSKIFKILDLLMHCIFPELVELTEEAAKTFYSEFPEFGVGYMHESIIQSYRGTYLRPCRKMLNSYYLATFINRVCLP